MDRRTTVFSNGLHDFLKRRGQTSSKSTTIDTLSVEDSSFFSVHSSRSKLCADSQTLQEDREFERAPETDRDCGENSVPSVSSVKILSNKGRNSIEQTTLNQATSRPNVTFRCAVCDKICKRKAHYTKHMENHAREQQITVVGTL